MIALRYLRSSANCTPSALLSAGNLLLFRSWTCDKSCVICPVFNHSSKPFRKNSSVKSRLQIDEYARPALVSDPFRFRSPTSPGHCPDQFATVKIGPLWLRSPGSTWWLYCHAAVANTSFASG